MTLLVIPARYGSTRFPGKPLALIAGRSVLARTVGTAIRAARGIGAAVVVATDDPRIAEHASACGVRVAMTGDHASGTGRALAAARAEPHRPAIVVNLQGDAPFTPPAAIIGLIETLRAGTASIATPLIALDWDGLDRLRADKITTPFTGTTCVRAADGRALWFSKAIVPAIRDEAGMRARGERCPVFRHLGVYAYRFAALEAFEALGPSPYETLEGLEQLRLIEAGIPIATVVVAPPKIPMSGIDTPEDIVRAEALIAQLGDPWDDPA